MKPPTKDWIQTLKGKPCFPVALTPEMVDLRDIPVALARRKRFSGQTVEFLNGVEVEGYSVAQHCELGSRLIAPQFALAFHLHELSEVYLPDVPKPIKPILFVDVSAALEHYAPDDVMAMPDGRALVTWETLEAQHAWAMMAALGLSSVLPLLNSPEVKAMDGQMLAAEKKFLMGPEPMPWGLPCTPEPGAKRVHAHSSERVSGEALVAGTLPRADRSHARLRSRRDDRQSVSTSGGDRAASAAVCRNAPRAG